MPTKKLPVPDHFGNYWFGKISEGPAVFRSKSCYIVFLGVEKGFVFEGVNLKRFKYLQEAVDKLEELR